LSANVEKFQADAVLFASRTSLFDHRNPVDSANCTDFTSVPGFRVGKLTLLAVGQMGSIANGDIHRSFAATPQLLS
jgi:hypothetical protein